MIKKKLISIGIPCFNEEKNVVQIYIALKKITHRLTKYSFEYIFVDNGSADKTAENIKKLAQKDSSLVGVFLSRNFGPEASLQAILDHVSGDAFIGIPCDFEDPPELIPEFIKKWEQGNNIVAGVYTKSEDDIFTSLLRKAFYGIFKRISNIDIPVNASGVGLLDKKSLQALNSLPEKYRFYRGLRAWIGFKTAYIKYTRKKRTVGKSSYSMLSYFRHAERGVFGFTYLFLDIIIYLGFILVLLSFLFIAIYIIFALLYSNPIKGSITILVAIVFFGGVQLLAISVIGKYIQVIAEETKNRPMYIIEDTINYAKFKI